MRSCARGSHALRQKNNSAEPEGAADPGERCAKALRSFIGCFADKPQLVDFICE
jgi:hypothetical protein